MKYLSKSIRYSRIIALLLLCGWLTPTLSALDLEKDRKFIGKISDGCKQIMEDRNDVPGILMSIFMLDNDNKDKGIKEDAPEWGWLYHYNLCLCSLYKGTLFCQDNKNIKREKMPQLKGKPVQGGKASELAKNHPERIDKRGEIDLNQEFRDFLKEHDCTITLIEDVDASKLRATQNELVGSKVASMWFCLKSHPNDPGTASIKEPIFVSKAESKKNQRWILDGHHRWAAVYATAFGGTAIRKVLMPVYEVNRDIEELLTLSKKFLDIYQIAAEAA